MSSSQFKIRNKCMDVLSSNYNNGVPIGIWDCGLPDQLNQQFIYNNNDNTIRPVNAPNKCLDLPNGNLQPGTVNYQLWDCNGGNGQQYI